jgi:uroporphyrinogen decarboxylase
MPQFLKFPVASRDDWRLLLPHLDPAAAAQRIGDPVVLQRLCSNPDVPTLLPVCGAYGHPRNIFGEEGLAYVLYDDPGLLEEVLENWLALYVELLRALTRIVPVDSVLVWEDMCFKTGPLISPEHFRRLFLPRYKLFIAAARDCGIRCIIVDTDGDFRALLPAFLEAEVDAFMPFEVQAGMDVVALRAEFGPTFGILGGLDKRALALDKRSIVAEVERVLPRFPRDGRFIPSLDHTIPVDVSLANFRYYLDCVREHERELAI